jgi:hypothetical protein
MALACTPAARFSISFKAWAEIQPIRFGIFRAVYLDLEYSSDFPDGLLGSP